MNARAARITRRVANLTAMLGGSSPGRLKRALRREWHRTPRAERAARARKLAFLAGQLEWKVRERGERGQ